MLSQTQLRKIGYLSDTVLYSEAVALVRRLIETEECKPLNRSQAFGLLSISLSNRYGDVHDYIIHQRDRDWQSNKQDIKVFYTELEKALALMQRQRLRDEFQLLSEESGQGKRDIKGETVEIMGLLAREYIQHLVAENNLLEATRQKQGPPARRQQTEGRPR